MQTALVLLIAAQGTKIVTTCLCFYAAKVHPSCRDHQSSSTEIMPFSSPTTTRVFKVDSGFKWKRRFAARRNRRSLKLQKNPPSESSRQDEWLEVSLNQKHFSPQSTATVLHLRNHTGARLMNQIQTETSQREPTLAK